METIRLESPAPDRGFTAQRIISFARNQIRTDRQSSHSMVAMIEKVFSVNRNVAAAVLFREVVLRNATKEQVEINWPSDKFSGNI